jgi:hypothetical protein
MPSQVKFGLSVCFLIFQFFLSFNSQKVKTRFEVTPFAGEYTQLTPAWRRFFFKSILLTGYNGAIFPFPALFSHIAAMRGDGL